MARELRSFRRSVWDPQLENWLYVAVKLVLCITWGGGLLVGVSHKETVKVDYRLR